MLEIVLHPEFFKLAVISKVFQFHFSAVMYSKRFMDYRLVSIITSEGIEGKRERRLDTFIYKVEVLVCPIQFKYLYCL